MRSFIYKCTFFLTLLAHKSARLMVLQSTENKIASVPSASLVASVACIQATYFEQMQADETCNLVGGLVPNFFYLEFVIHVTKTVLFYLRKCQS